MDKVHTGKKTKFNKYNFEDEIFIRGEERSIPVKVIIKKKGSNFMVTRAPPTHLFPTTHLYKISPSHFGQPSLYLSLYSLLFSFHTTLFFHSLILSRQYTPHHH